MSINTFPQWFFHVFACAWSLNGYVHWHGIQGVQSKIIPSLRDKGARRVFDRLHSRLAKEFKNSFEKLV